MPERFAKPATVFGSLPGPIEIEFSGMGLQYTNVTVAIGPDEYESDPIEVTVLVQGEGAQSTIWLLTIPSDAIDGTFTLDGNVYDIPLSGSLASLESYLDSEYATVTTSTSGTETTITFDGTGSYSPASFASAALRAATCTVVVSTTGGIDGTLVLYDLVGGAGPKWFFSSQNWDGNTVPTLNDELILDDASGDVKYGIDLVHQFLPYSSTRLIWTDRVNRFRSGQRIVIDHTDMDGSFYVRDALPDGTFALSTTANGDLVEFDTFEEGTGAFKASLEVSARYSGNIGLAEYVGALPEYLPKYLSMYYVSLDLGNGTGDGLSLGRFDLSTFATSVNIHKSGDADVYSAILLLVNSADTVIAATNASVGIGEILGETCLFDTFEGTAVELVIGRNTSYISVHNSGSTKHLAADRYFT